MFLLVVVAQQFVVGLEPHRLTLVQEWHLAQMWVQLRHLLPLQKSVNL